MQVIYENVIRSTTEYQELKRSLQHKITPIVAQGLFETLGSHVLAALLEDLSSSALIVCQNNASALKMVEDLAPLLGQRLIHMPSKEVVFLMLMHTVNKLFIPVQRLFRNCCLKRVLW